MKGLSKAERHALKRDIRHATRHGQSWLPMINLWRMPLQQARVMLAEARKRKWFMNFNRSAWAPPAMRDVWASPRWPI